MASDFVQESITDADAFATEFADAEVRRFFDGQGRITDPAGLKAYEDRCYARFVEKYGLPTGDGRRNVCWFLSDLAGCGYVRGFVPARSIQLHGTRYNALVSAVVCTELVRWADVIVWQRTTTEQAVNAFRVAKHLGKLQVYETDDNLHEIPSSNPAWQALHPGTPAYRTSLTWMRSCDERLVSTVPLKAYYERVLGRPCTVLPNTIDIGQIETWPPPPRHDVPRRPSGSDRVRLLWAGSSSHIDDLAVVRGALRRLKDDYRKRVKIVLMGFEGRLVLPTDAADPTDVVEYTGVDLGITRDKFLPWIGHVGEYHRKLHDLGFHVGLCPLADNLFNRGKSNLKWLEYSVAGLATVATDLDPYRAAIENGKDGLLVDNREESWHAALVRLVEDAALREALVDNARRKIRARFDAAQVWQAYEAFFDEALARLGTRP